MEFQVSWRCCAFYHLKTTEISMRLADSFAPNLNAVVLLHRKLIRPVLFFSKITGRKSCQENKQRNTIALYYFSTDEL